MIFLLNKPQNRKRRVEADRAPKLVGSSKSFADPFIIAEEERKYLLQKKTTKDLISFLMGYFVVLSLFTLLSCCLSCNCSSWESHT